MPALIYRQVSATRTGANHAGSDLQTGVRYADRANHTGSDLQTGVRYADRANHTGSDLQTGVRYADRRKSCQVRSTDRRPLRGPAEIMPALIYRQVSATRTGANHTSSDLQTGVRYADRRKSYRL